MIDLTNIFNTTISGIIIQLPVFILVYIGFKIIAKEIKIGIKNIPNYVEQYFYLRNKQIRLERALEVRI